MIAEYPRDPNWHLGLGLAYYDDGHYLSAVESLRTSLRLGGPEPLIRQIVRSATSVGANYCEADDAVSKKDFRLKIGTCKKESR